VSGTAAQLIAQANQHYTAALKDLQAGDFANYAKEIQAVGALLQQLAALQPSASPGASASPSASASP